MSDFTADVLICGAGAAGLTLAIDLARRNVSFRLIDKLDAPFRGSRGKGIQPRTLEVFEDLGIIDAITRIGGPYPPSREYRPDGSFSDTALFEKREATTSEPFQQPLMVPQFLTEMVMREKLAELGHEPQYGAALQGFEQDDHGVTVRIARQTGEETLRVRYLVGTDGGRSFVRQALDIDFPGKTLGIRAVVADVALRGLGRDAWHQFNEGDMGRMIALCPLSGTDLFQLQGPVPLEGEVDLSSQGLNDMVHERTGRQDILIESISWASAYTMNARLAESYRAGRVFLAGDAAHIHPPTGGQGLNTSVQDAYNLGWKLSAVLHGAPESLLDTYEEERRPIAAEMLGLTTRLLEAARQGDKKRGREVHQIDLGYPSSSLALEGASRSGPAAGDRAPDARIVDTAGRSARLFDLFKGPHWTLIGYEIGHAAPFDSSFDLHVHTIGNGGDLIDDANQVRDTYGLESGDWVLVRPDGYIGARTAAGERLKLEAYMERAGLAHTMVK